MRILIISSILITLFSSSAYAFWPFTVRSDMVGYCAPCWGENNKIYFIKKVTFGRAISGKTALHAILFMGGSYFADHTEVYLCSMNYDGTDKKEIVKIGDTDDDTYWLPMYLDYCQVKNLLLLSGGAIPSGGTSHGIWTIKTDGTGLKRILDAGMHASSSPDGKRIVYQLQEPDSNSWDNFSETIWVMNADGTNKHKISSDGTNPIWSPKDDLIAFTCKDWIWVMKPDGSERRRVKEGSYFFGWLPDGKGIISSGGSETGWSISDLNGNIIRKPKWGGYVSLDGRSIFTLDFTVFDIDRKVEIKPLADIKHSEHFVYKKPNNMW
ncbi:MAG: hypothetical protein AB1414_13445 [bacterium]